MNTSISYFTTPSGDEMAMLPRAELEALCERAEMAMDVTVYDAVKAADEEEFPAEFVNALLTTDRPMREYRKYRGLSQTQLAEAVGVRQATISAIESGTSPALETAAAIARALSVDIEDIFYANDEL